MADFEINDFLLNKECEELAKEIYDEWCDEHPGENPEDGLDFFDERAHETADGHEWVIYNYKALMICAHCDVSEGEEFLEDVGMPEEVTIYKLASTIVFGTMRAKIMAEIGDMVDAWEEPEDDEDEDDEEIIPDDL